jgi:hypothetical protein
MGARVNFVFKTELDKPNIVLYSHWGETTWRFDLAMAIERANPRLKMGDVPYATRIMISSLIGNDWESETGYGIYLLTDTEVAEGMFDFPVEIDMTTQMINDEGNWHSFESFREYHLEEMTANHSFDNE